MSQQKELHVIVSGRVQGVGFRYTVQQLASQLGITGTVRNLENGNVEIYAQGEQESLDNLLLLIQKKFGPEYISSIEKEFHSIENHHKKFSVIR